MGGEISTIQSLKAVDAWIDVINANINGGVRTAFKSSRLKFSGSNTDIQRAGNTTSLPLQFPEPGLTTANTIIDFTQGAITTSTENTHLAVQGDGFFTLMPAAALDLTQGIYSGAGVPAGVPLVFLTRDGEFHTDQRGMLVHSSGLYLVTVEIVSGSWPGGNVFRTVYNNLDAAPTGAGLTAAVKLSDFLGNAMTTGTLAADGVTPLGVTVHSLMRVPNGKQSLQYSTYGSTVFDMGHRHTQINTFSGVTLASGTTADATILSKSLESSNSSMTQSVPELSLAQKLFSALTKVLQTKQTNVDGVLNLVR